MVLKSLQQRFNSDDYYQVLSMLLLFAAVILLVGIGWRSPWPADEPRFAEVAREMVDCPPSRKEGPKLFARHVCLILG